MNSDKLFFLFTSKTTYWSVTPHHKLQRYKHSKNWTIKKYKFIQWGVLLRSSYYRPNIVHNIRWSDVYFCDVGFGLFNVDSTCLHFVASVKKFHDGVHTFLWSPPFPKTLAFRSICFVQGSLLLWSYYLFWEHQRLEQNGTYVSLEVQAFGYCRADKLTPNHLGLAHDQTQGSAL